MAPRPEGIGTSRAAHHASGYPVGHPRPAARVSARVGSISGSVTLAIDAKAKALKAAGRPVIGFAAGEPDFPTPAPIVAAAEEACRDPRNHRYTPAAGLPELREAIAEKTWRDSGLRVEPSQVLVTNGGKQAVYPAFATLLDPGDEVLLPAPYWTTYPEAAALAGGIAVPVPTDESSGYLPSVDAARGRPHRADQGAAVVLAVEPDRRGRATASWPRDRPLGGRARRLGDRRRDLRAPGLRRRGGGSMPAVVPELADRCVVVNGVAKTYAMTGWRVGWMIGPPDVVKAAVNLQSHLSSNVNNVAQRAALAAVSGPLDAVAEMRTAFDRRRRAIVGAVRDPRRRVPDPARGVLRLPVGARPARPGAPRRPAAGHASSWPS